MYAAILICAACLAAEPDVAPTIASQNKSNELAAYEEIRSKRGRGADEHVRIALWCEAHGLYAERLKHLALAVMTQPDHAAARGLLGLVAFGGQWRSPEAISEKLRADEARSAALAEYNGRRARMGTSADAHWKIALWCEQQGLKPEAAAHLTMVTQLDPRHEAAWKRLGYQKQGRGWATTEELAAEKSELKAQKKADKHWTAFLTKQKSALEDKSKQDRVPAALAEISDPRAVPAVWATFAQGNGSHQEIAVQVLGQIDSHGSTRALALLALAGKSPEVRSKATQTLRFRSPHEIASFLIALLRDPDLDPDPILYHYNLLPVGWNGIGSLGVLFVKGPFYDVLRTYRVAESSMLTDPSGFVMPTPLLGYESRVMGVRARQATDVVEVVNQILTESEATVLNAKDHIRQVNELNERIIRVLKAAIGKSYVEDREVWRKWWAEEQGYTYNPPPPAPRQDLTVSDDKPTYFAEVSVDCFVAGTPVHTLTGLTPIERIEVGDQVLTQDPSSGTLSYQPVVATVHSQPEKLVKISLSDDVINATGIDRFWKAGEGWVMARDLKPGDRLRSVGGISTVKNVEVMRSQPVFNLKVMQAQSFFVGRQGMLVHDNSLVEPVTHPFDAMADALRTIR